jgi:hypothetical protein
MPAASERRGSEAAGLAADQIQCGPSWLFSFFLRYFFLLSFSFVLFLLFYFYLCLSVSVLCTGAQIAMKILRPIEQ